MTTGNFNIRGKNALVTGSSRGLGAAIALAFAKAGANVAVHGSQKPPCETAEAIRAAGSKTIELVADLADATVYEKLIEGAVNGLGSIDILVNNAGTIRRSPAIDYSEKDWYEVLQTNLSSIFRLCQLAGRQMLARHSGKIINIASLLSFQGGILVPSYAAAKGGVAQLTKALANEWASQGVNVNAIAPGYMATDNTAALRNDATQSRQIMERIPAGRWGTPEDVADAAVFLASPASNYIHGHMLVVDGGWLAR